jgi:hypothetical protein
MKLQVKDSGAWRNVLGFDESQRADVEAAGAALLEAAGCSKATMRICEGETVLARCEAPAYQWRPA